MLKILAISAVAIFWLEEVALSTAPRPSPTSRLPSILIEPLYVAPSEEDLPETPPSQKINAIRANLINSSGEEVSVLWCDFFARVNRGKWVGSWWQPSLSTLDKMNGCFNTSSYQKTTIPPHSSASCMLVDPWADETIPVEYKFVCFVANGEGEPSMIESPAVTAVPLNVEKSGIELALTGISSAIKSLLKSDSSSIVEPDVKVGATINYRPMGLVEAHKNQSMAKEMSMWAESEGIPPVSAYFYAYQVEVANNTTSPLRLALLVVSTNHDGAWVSGVLKKPIIEESEIITSAFLQGTDESGLPVLRKMTDSWIPPGFRAIMPNQWHPKAESSTPVRHLAVLLTKSGDPVFAEGETDETFPPVPLSRPPSLGPQEKR